jgi:hypothetical protein
MKIVEMPLSKTPGEVVALLERLIEMTEEGEMTDIAIACMFRDKSATSSFFIGLDPIGLLGAISVLKQRVLNEGIP